MWNLFLLMTPILALSELRAYRKFTDEIAPKISFKEVRTIDKTDLCKKAVPNLLLREMEKECVNEIMKTIRTSIRTKRSDTGSTVCMSAELRVEDL